MLKFICFNLRFNTLNAIHIIIWVLTISIVRFWVSAVLLRVGDVKFFHTHKETSLTILGNLKTRLDSAKTLKYQVSTNIYLFSVVK